MPDTPQEFPKHFFYYKNGRPEVTLQFDPDDHIYYRLMADGSREAQDGVTSVLAKGIDHSLYLIPWAAKVAIEKLLRTVPTKTKRLGQNSEGAWEETVIPQMPFAEFEKIALAAKSAHKDKLIDAGNVGTLAHNALETSIHYAIEKTAGVVKQLYGLPDDERARNCCDAALTWMRAHNVRWKLTEKKVYSLKHRYAGTMDGLCVVDSCADSKCCQGVRFADRISVADWKSSNQLKVEYCYQTAAYLLAYHEEFWDVNVSDRFILRLGKDDGKFDPWHLPAETVDTDFEVFLSCLQLVRQHRSVEERMSEMGKRRTAAKRQAKKEEDFWEKAK